MISARQESPTTQAEAERSIQNINRYYIIKEIYRTSTHMVKYNEYVLPGISGPAGNYFRACPIIAIRHECICSIVTGHRV